MILVFDLDLDRGRVIWTGMLGLVVLVVAASGRLGQSSNQGFAIDLVPQLSREVEEGRRHWVVV